MSETQNDLWMRIQTFVIDAPGAEFPFSSRLASEQGWSLEFTERAILEYKKFAYLFVVAGHPVTPSKVVDEVWHLHLIYTESYWDRFCGDILGQPFHHHPSSGGEADKEKFEDWYRLTRESYAEVFGEEPPLDIWPAGDAPSQPKDMVFVPRPTTIPVSLINSPLAWAIIGLIVPSLCLLFPGQNPFDLPGPEFLGFYVSLAGLSVITGFAAVRFLGTTDRSDSGAALAIYEVARLSGGWEAVLRTAMASVVAKGVVELKSRKQFATGRKLAPWAPPIERTILDKVLDSSGENLASWTRLLRREFEDIDAGLIERGLLMTNGQWLSRRVVLGSIMLWPLLIGWQKTMIGLERDRPVVILLLLQVFVLLVAVGLVFSFSRVTKLGTEIVKGLQNDNSDLMRQARDAGPLKPELVTASVAMFGISAIKGSNVGQDLQTLFPPPSSHSGSDSGSSCASGGCGSSGCGGGGGGSGCGGCSGGH